jgi:hypothetical protein
MTPLETGRRPVSRANQIVASILAVTAWTAVGLQCLISVQSAAAKGRTALGELITLYSFFTILTNTIIAVGLTVPLVAWRSRLAEWLESPAIRTATASYITLVGIVYSLALRHTWNPQGLQLFVDHLLHDVVPVAFVAYWAVFVGRGRVRWSDIPRWLGFPVVYLIYTMIRGPIVDWYPYPFLDVRKLGYARTFLNAAVLLATFSAIGAMFVAVDRVIVRTTGRMRSSRPH